MTWLTGLLQRVSSDALTANRKAEHRSRNLKFPSMETKYIARTLILNW